MARPDLLVRPLYVVRAGKYGRRGGNISANLVNIRTNLLKFARWGSGYAYHVEVTQQEIADFARLGVMPVCSTWTAAAAV